MVPGFLDTSWKALDNRAGLEGSEVSGGTAHHEGLVLQASETLSAAIWRQICEHFPSILKRINNVFLLLNYFLKIVIFAVFLFCSNYLCYLSHVDAYAHAQEHLILSSAYFSFSFSRTENLWKGKSLWSQVSMHTKILIVVYKCKTNPHKKKDKQCISDVHTNISCVKLLINVVVIHK